MNPFSLLVGLASALGLLQVSRHAPPRESPRWTAAALWVLAGSLLGARLGYVLFTWSYFRRHPVEAFHVWNGGLSWPGAVAGGLLVCLLLSLLWRQPLALFLDRIAPLVPPLAIAVWLGCWQMGVAYGAAAPPNAWWGVPAPDEAGGIAPRFPLQLIAALTLLLFFAWLELRPSRFSRPGHYTVLLLAGLAVALLAFSFLRVDPAPLWAGLRPDTWGAVAFFVLVGIFTALVFLPLPRPPVSPAPDAGKIKR